MGLFYDSESDVSKADHPKAEHEGHKIYTYTKAGSEDEHYERLSYGNWRQIDINTCAVIKALNHDDCAQLDKRSDVLIMPEVLASMNIWQS